MTRENVESEAGRRAVKRPGDHAGRTEQRAEREDRQRLEYRTRPFRRRCGHGFRRPARHEIVMAHRKPVALDRTLALARYLALELADAALEDPRQPDYRFLLAWEGEALAGYICFGPTPMS